MQLIDQAIEDLRTYQSEFPNTYARVWVINPKLVRVLEKRYGFEIESQYNDGSAHMLRMPADEYSEPYEHGDYSLYLSDWLARMQRGERPQ